MLNIWRFSPFTLGYIWDHLLLLLVSVNTIDKSNGFTVACVIVLVTGCNTGGFDKNSFAGVNEPTDKLCSVNDEIEPDESYENLWTLSLGVPSKLIGCAGGRTTRTGDWT